MIAIRPLARDEFGKVAEFDVTEEGRIAYAWRGGRLVSVLQEWRRPPLTSARVEQIVAAWRWGLWTGTSSSEWRFSCRTSARPWHSSFTCT